MIVHNEDDLMMWQRSWANYHVLLAMAQLGLFDLLADGQARTALTLAAQLQADARALDICGRILTRAGLLNYADSKFSLTDTAQQLTSALTEVTREWRRRQNFTDLLETVRSGRPAMATTGGVLEDNEADARQFLKMLYRQSAIGVLESLRLVQQLQREHPGHEQWHILDLGGGHGRYAATFAAALPQTQATLFDRPLPTRLAREISGNGFSTRSGDFLCDELGGPYDIVFMAYIVSGIALGDIRTLFKRLRGAVNDGGYLVLEDMFVDPVAKLEPGIAIDFQLTLLLENEHGRFRTVPEISDLLSEAGFRLQRVHPINGKDFSFVVAS